MSAAKTRFSSFQTSRTVWAGHVRETHRGAHANDVTIQRRSTRAPLQDPPRRACQGLDWGPHSAAP